MVVAYIECINRAKVFFQETATYKVKNEDFSDTD
tara:strand:+ start:940 stop:1041 length:102 start_codon:yes stop_codon:yes gene_type:complete